MTELLQKRSMREFWPKFTYFNMAIPEPSPHTFDEWERGTEILSMVFEDLHRNYQNEKAFYDTRDSLQRNTNDQSQAQFYELVQDLVLKFNLRPIPQRVTIVCGDDFELMRNVYTELRRRCFICRIDEAIDPWQYTLKVNWVSVEWHSPI